MFKIDYFNGLRQPFNGLRQPFNAERLRLNVEAGASFLDKECPQWAYLIDLAALDVDSATCCVLGQLYGGYVNAIAMMLDGNPIGFSTGIGGLRWDISHGFFVESCTDEAVAATNSYWKIEIGKRLEQKEI